MITHHNSIPSVLITDDQPGLRLALRANFARHGWQVETASGLSEALGWLDRRRFDLVLCDVRMGDGDGFEVLEAVRSMRADTAFLFLTAYGSVPEAVRAMQGGAVDYLTKPISFDQLHLVATRILNRRSSDAASAPVLTSGCMVGRSREFQAALARAHAAAASDSHLLIEAENGTGKSLLARYIHDHSPRASKPFVTLDCAALNPEAAERLTNDHEDSVAGLAAHLDAARGGTLFLRAAEGMPLDLQRELLHLLQRQASPGPKGLDPKRLNLRIISSAQPGLPGRVHKGLFLSDLYYDLSVISLTLPRLRERKGDVAVLARFFAQRYATSLGQRAPSLHRSVLERLEAHDWPGNVREVADVMETVLSSSFGPELTAADLDRAHRSIHAVPPMRSSPTSANKPSLSMDQVERSHLERTLELVGGNRTRAAEILGISVRTMRNKIRQYDLPPRRYA